MDLCSMFCLSWWQTLLLLFVIYTIYMSWHFPLWYRQGIPVPTTPIPVFGSMLGFISKGLLEQTKDAVGKYGKTTGGFLGRQPALMTIDTDILKEVFIKESSTFPHRTAFQTGDPMNDLMLSNVIDYEHWKNLRRIMSPTFSSGKLKRMMKQINKCGSVYARHLTKQNGKAVELKDCAGSFTMDVIAITSFGLDFNTAEDPNNPFGIHAKKALDSFFANPLFIIMIFLPFLMPIIRLLIKPSMFDKASVEFFKEVTKQTLEARKDDDERVDFFQLLKDAHKEIEAEGNTSVRGLTSDELLAQSILFFLAGYDTTATSISLLAYNLALTPNKQDILLEEIDEVVGDKEFVNEEDLHQMPYLEMCVNESLRLYPPILQIDRIASKDVVVKGIKLPKGSSIAVPIYHMHRLPELYPDPEEFKPERFSSENKNKRDTLSFMPFGAGPRMCLATRLALIEVKIATIHILKTHRFVRSPETEVPLTLKDMGILQAKNGVWLKVEPR